MSMLNNHVAELKAEVTELREQVVELTRRVRMSDRTAELTMRALEINNDNVASIIRYQQQLVHAMEAAGVRIPLPRD